MPWQDTVNSGDLEVLFLLAEKRHIRIHFRYCFLSCFLIPNIEICIFHAFSNSHISLWFCLYSNLMLHKTSNCFTLKIVKWVYQLLNSRIPKSELGPYCFSGLLVNFLDFVMCYKDKRHCFKIYFERTYPVTDSVRKWEKIWKSLHKEFSLTAG